MISSVEIEKLMKQYDIPITLNNNSSNNVSMKKYIMYIAIISIIIFIVLLFLKPKFIMTKVDRFKKSNSGRLVSLKPRYKVNIVKLVITILVLVLLSVLIIIYFLNPRK